MLDADEFDVAKAATVGVLVLVETQHAVRGFYDLEKVRIGEHVRRRKAALHKRGLVDVVVLRTRESEVRREERFGGSGILPTVGIKRGKHDVGVRHVNNGSSNVGAGEHDGGMTRYAIDALTAIRIAREGVTVHASHQLVGPKFLHSDALSLLFAQVRAGELAEPEARALLDAITTMKIRLLGDRVSRATAWRVASTLGLDDTFRAEYVAVAQLQADALITGDADFARTLDGIVPLAAFEALEVA